MLEQGTPVARRRPRLPGWGTHTGIWDRPRQPGRVTQASRGVTQVSGGVTQVSVSSPASCH